MLPSNNDNEDCIRQGAHPVYPPSSTLKIGKWQLT